MTSDAWQSAADLRTGTVSSVHLVNEALAAARDQVVNAFTVVLEETALTSAREADVLLAKGSRLPLLGVPVSVKDHIWMTGTPATNGSLALRDFVPPEDNVAVARLDTPAYSMVSYAWGQRYQQSNQWAIETLAVAMAPEAGAAGVDIPLLGAAIAPPGMLLLGAPIP